MKELPKFQGAEYGDLSHFYDKYNWYRVVDVWGQEGWCVGYRDFQQSKQYFKGKRSTEGFGGELYIMYDIDNSVAAVDPTMVKALEKYDREDEYSVG